MRTRYLSCGAIALMSSLSLQAAEPPMAEREQLNAVVWYQAAAESQANGEQTYRAATDQLARLKRNKAITALPEQLTVAGYKRLPPAVILDIDETVLDNSPYNAWQVASGLPYSEPSWDAWVAERKATAVPGAKAFISAARRMGFKVLYVTNRNCEKQGGYDAQGWAKNCPQLQATLANLEAELGYRPDYADMLLKYQRAEWDGKGVRRQLLANRYRIAMLVGDDLNDFVDRNTYQPEQHAANWGRSWFVLSNPMYGSSLRALGNNLSKRYGSLKPWQWAPAKVAEPAVVNP